MKTIAVLGTFDTKGLEHAFVAERIREHGYQTLLIDVGTFAPPTVLPDIARERVLRSTALSATDRGSAVAEMSQAIPAVLRQLVAVNRIQGIISMGGSGGTAIGTAAMRALPIGFPKVMVSTLASGNVSQYVDVSDIVMFPSVVDVSGLNRISRGVFARAAAAVVGMAEANAQMGWQRETQPLVVASMFGNTTCCVDHAKRLLEESGYEVMVFHATGTGGRTMEALIESGVVAGVLDVTTTEWADELVGGVMRGGSKRLDAAALHGIPAVVAPGCLDMVNFGEPSTVPEKFKARNFYQHNPHVTLMRTTADECRELGRIMASKLNQSTGPISVVFPLKGISVISAAGQPFHDPTADRALLNSLRESLRPDIPVEVLECEINDQVFSEHCVKRLIQFIAQGQGEGTAARDN